jgi:3,4-dihydroxy-2-butanone 4-phosphate synthase
MSVPGVLCVGLPAQECRRLELPLMVPTHENEESMYTAFTITVDLRQGIRTGISASDRCKTIRALGSPDTQAADLRKPGHIFPLIARDHGVLTRPGHTEAAVDLARLAGALFRTTRRCACSQRAAPLLHVNGLHKRNAVDEACMNKRDARLRTHGACLGNSMLPVLYVHALNARDVAMVCAGCQPAGVLCEVVDKSTGEMAKTDLLLHMAQEHGLHCVTIKDLIRHRVQHEQLTSAAVAQLVLGDLQLHTLQCTDGSKAAYAAVGDVGTGPAQLLFHEVWAC